MSYIYDEKIATPLCEIMGNHNSDKGNVDIINSHHNYTTFYYSIFKDIQYSYLKIFELGIGTNNINIPSNMGENGNPGASLYGWSDFFVNSKIFGADIDSNILFNTEKIKTFYCDQTNKDSILNMWNNNELHDEFDIIIEDGLHTFSANVCFFENSIHKLKKTGFYIIEDINVNDINLFHNKIEEWKLIYPNLLFEIIQIPSTKNIHDNNLLLIKNIE
jgi:hypothetical protein